MARTRFHDFRQEDSTKLFNERFRAIIPHGVYTGFNVVAGTSGGLYLDFQHDNDPDRTGQVLGSMVTPDGVEIQEDLNQQDVVLGSLSAGTPNVHYVVASYTYNRALPNNDVVYTILQGTSGSPPTPPILTDDQILLAIIDVPAGAVAYTSAGVRIKTVAKKTLWDFPIPSFFKNLSDVLDPGIYEGIEMSVGSTALKVSLSLGSWITKESIRIQELAAQADLFTITAPSAGNYKFVWAIGAHKHEDMTPYPDADYMLVHGADAAVGTQATLPSDSAIISAMGAVSSKYDSINYANKLGIIRIENRAGVYYIDYIKGETVMDRQSIVVYGANAQSMNRSGKYYGYNGLKQAVADIYAITQALTTNENCPFEILLDGDFKTDDYELRMPSNLALKGYGAAARIMSEYGTPLSIRGWDCSWNSVNATVVVSAGVTTPPTGYVSKVLAIQATYQSGDEFAIARFSRGDRFLACSTGTGNTYEGQFVQRTGSWTCEVFLPTEYQTDGAPTDLDIAIVKRNSSIENLEVSGINLGTGMIDVSVAEKCRLDKVVTNRLYIRAIRECNWGHVVVKNAISNWSGFSNQCWYGGFNVFERITFYDTANTATLHLGTGCLADTIHVFEYDNPTHGSTGVTIRPEFNGLTCGLMRVNAFGVGVSVLGLYYDDQNYQQIIAPACKVQTGNGRRIFVQDTNCSNLELQANGLDTLFVFVNAPNGIVNTCSNPKNRVLFSSSDALQNDGMALLNPDEDRNLRLLSLANVSWNSTTGLLTWDAPLKIDIPWQTGYTQVNANPSGLLMNTDGDRAFIDIDRDAAGTTLATPNVRHKASATADRFYRNRVFLAIRDQGVIYLFDGTRIESTQTVKVGSTPPPDGSVTWVKLGDSALAFHEKFFRDYVVDDNVDGFSNDVVFLNSALRTMSYTSSTGVIQYSGAVDLSLVQPGDYVILRNISFDPATAGQKGFTFEEVLAVSDAGDNITIAKGLDINGGLGGAHIWNGAIARGAKVFVNDNGAGVPYTYSYDPTNGRVTYSSAPGFSQYKQVQKGYLWLDSSLNKYVIQDVDAAGQWIQLKSNLRSVDMTVPTTRYQGSIERNINPFNVPLADLRVTCGAEFVPIDRYGGRDISPDNWLSGTKAWDNDFNLVEKHVSVPYDKRVRLLVIPIILTDSSTTTNSFEVDDNHTRNGHQHYGPMGIQFVCFTGLCSGVSLVYDGGSDALPGGMYIDGEQTFASKAIGYVDPENHNNAFDYVQNRYVVQGGCNTGNNQPIARYLRLPYGVHTIMWRIKDPKAIPRGILVYGHPLNGTKTPVVSDSPGVAVQRGGVNTLTSTRRVSTPTLPAWNKGGRMLRYLDKVGGRSFATSAVRSFSTLGTVSSGSADITSVTNIGLWRVGDMVLIIDTATGNRYLKRITIINTPLVQLTVDSVINFTHTGTTLYFYGVSYFGAHDRSNEEVASVHSILDFVGGGPVSNSHTTACVVDMFLTTPRVTGIGTHLSDLSTTIFSPDNTPGLVQNQGGRLQLDVAGQSVRFRFVGTGFSVRRYDIQGLQVTVDEDYIGTLTTNPVLDTDDDLGGTFICGELPYGEHIVKLLLPAGGSPCYIYGFTVWKSKKPTIPSTDLPALELLDVNLVADSEASMGIVTRDGAEAMQFGTIPIQAAGVMTAATQNNMLRDLWAYNTLSGQALDWGGGGIGVQIVGDYFEFTFFGDEVTMVEDQIISGVGDAIEVQFLDHDGVFKRPSLLTGFTATGGPDTFTAWDLVTGRRWRWVLSELGPHVMRFRVSVTGGGLMNMAYDMFEVHCPFHVCRTKEPVGIDLYMPYQQTGLDVRPLSAFQADGLVGANLPHQQSARQADRSIDSWFNNNAFCFYTRTGLVNLRCIAQWYTDVTLNPITLYIDNVSMRTQFVETASAVDWIVTPLEVEIALSPGFHFAFIVIGGSAGYYIGGARYFARDIERAANSIPSQGLGVPKLGPANPALSAF